MGGRTNLKTYLVISALLLGIYCTVAAGGTIYIDADAPPGGDGSNWTNAYKYLQDALADANSSSKPVEIWVAEGTYKPDANSANPTGTNDRTATFQLKNGVALYGGYAGFGETDPNDRDINLYETVLSGDIGTPNDVSDNSYHVVKGSGTDETAILDGLTITGGNATYGGYASYGGGMYNGAGSPTLTNCTFSGNSAHKGGGLANLQSNPTITNCTFSQCVAFYMGGGMYNDNSSPTVVNCTFSVNSATNFGGGMYNGYNSSPTLTNCTFSGNSSDSEGGGMFNEYNSSPTVTDCNFSGNEALFGGGMYNESGSDPNLTNCTFSQCVAFYMGGGMYNDNGSPTVTSCNFSGNSATWGGGGGMDNRHSSDPTVTNCTFSGNSAYDYGGGMCNVFDSPALDNCTFSGNSADEGGGMFNAFSSPTVTNSTFSGNSSGYYGGGMCNSVDSSPMLTNCIFWGNTAPSGPQINDGTSPATVSYSDVQGSWPGTGNIDADPLFVDADGPDDIFGTEDDNLRLSAGSPCIDAGDNTAVPGGVTTDLDGKERFIEDPFTADTGNGTAPIVDMGAYEYNAGIIFVDADAPGANDGSSWANAFNYLQDALAEANSNPDVNEIWVAEGTYKPDANTANPDGTGDRTATFQLLNGVAIYGGYAGYWATEPNERDIEVYETILSGDINTPGDSSDNSYHVVTGSGTDANAILDGFTITAGNADGSHSQDSGGGMHNDNGSPTVTDCNFSSNSADGAGGGMYNFEASPILTYCTFTGNSADVGSAMWNELSYPRLINCTFSGNSAGVYGGGMYNLSSNPTLTNCTFSGDSADLSGDGMYNLSSNPTLVNCSFSGNPAYFSGGGMVNFGSSPMLINCTFSRNSVAGTFGNGGGIYNLPGASPTLTNCILWGNSDSGGVDESAQVYGGDPNIRHSCVLGLDTFAGNWNIGDDPLFVDANGPDGIAGTEDDNLRLSCGSPCIDAGDNEAVPDDVTTDLDGNPRIIDGDCNSTNVVDMGVYEFILGDVDGDGDIDWFDLDYFTDHWPEDGCSYVNEWCEGTDLNFDGIVNLEDYSTLAMGWAPEPYVP